MVEPVEESACDRRALRALEAQVRGDCAGHCRCAQVRVALSAAGRAGNASRGDGLLVENKRCPNRTQLLSVLVPVEVDAVFYQRLTSLGAEVLVSQEPANAHRRGRLRKHARRAAGRADVVRVLAGLAYRAATSAVGVRDVHSRRVRLRVVHAAVAIGRGLVEGEEPAEDADLEVEGAVRTLSDDGDLVGVEGVDIGVELAVFDSPAAGDATLDLAIRGGIENGPNRAGDGGGTASYGCLYFFADSSCVLEEAIAAVALRSIDPIGVKGAALTVVGVESARLAAVVTLETDSGGEVVEESAWEARLATNNKPVLGVIGDEDDLSAKLGELSVRKTRGHRLDLARLAPKEGEALETVLDVDVVAELRNLLEIGRAVNGTRAVSPDELSS